MSYESNSCLTGRATTDLVEDSRFLCFFPIQLPLEKCGMSYFKLKRKVVWTNFKVFLNIQKQKKKVLVVRSQTAMFESYDTDILSKRTVLSRSRV